MLSSLIKKDLLILKSGWKSYIFVLLPLIVCHDCLVLISASLLSFFTTSIIACDESNNWNVYASTLPKGRESVIKSKYIMGICEILISIPIATVLSYVINLIKKTPLEQTTYQIIPALILSVSFIFVPLPLVFKYGYKKAVLVSYIMSTTIATLLFVLIKIRFGNFEKFIAYLSRNTSSVEKYTSSYILVISGIICCIIITAFSYVVSKRVYLNREF